MKKYLTVVCASLLAMVCVGCAYDTPVYVQVETSETAFLVELEGDSEQGTIQSEEYLKDNMVATKRIGITYRWVDNGYMPLDGKYIPNERVIVVDRSPETREWTPGNTGTNARKDEAIWVESSDSVGFATGISITSRIETEADAVKFLYKYPPKTTREIEVNNGYKDNYPVSISDLADVMDTEVRTKIQEVFAEETAKYNMDELREKKNEILAAIREQVIPFFKESGITITAIGMFGGFQYENPDIQKAIDKVFEAQQDEEVAKAETQAAEQRKSALKLMGEGEAQQSVEIAKGRADAVKLEAEAEAEAIQAVADAKAYELSKLSENPEAYITLKNIEVEMQRLDVWDGKYPTFFMGGNSDGPKLNMFIPTPKLTTE